MKQTLVILSLVAISCIGCATARKTVAVGRAAIDAVVSVKDPVFNAVDKVIDASEGVKNSVVGGAKDTTAAVTQ